MHSLHLESNRARLRVRKDANPSEQRSERRARGLGEEMLSKGSSRGSDKLASQSQKLRNARVLINADDVSGRGYAEARLVTRDKVRQQDKTRNGGRGWAAG